MFTKVMIATDSSPASLAVISCAGALRKLGVQECVLAQCFLIREIVPFPDQIKAHIEETLEQQRVTLKEHGIRTSIVVEPGYPAKEIPRIALDEGCSLIVAGSHGQNLAREMFLGGTATELLHQAKLPTLIIRLKTDSKTGRAVVARKTRDFKRHLLFATDFSEHADQAFDSVRTLVAAGTDQVTLLHVQNKATLEDHLKERLDEFNAIDRERLEAMKEKLTAVGNASVEIRIPFGSPTEEILRCSQKINASLIVMGSHGRGYISELFLGSVSHNVARHSEAPILLIPLLLADSSRVGMELAHTDRRR
ncbi:MAG: universal stress protein [Kiritimatiellia bacterium]|jgi:nucleotide-binding universal stress UspA family protein